MKIQNLTCDNIACCCAVETDGATLMVPARADASVDATLTCGLPAESIVTLGTVVRTPGEAVTTCIKHQHFMTTNMKIMNPTVLHLNMGSSKTCDLTFLQNF
jgi:hypothetical protein